LSLCLVVFYPAKAISFIPGNLKFEKFNSERGFYQNTVNAITTDKNGYVWFATPNGLVKYDGYSFNYYYHDHEDPNSIMSNEISCLYNGSDGNLWIGTRNGVCLYLPDKEKFVTIQRTAFISDLIKEDPKKRIWVGTKSNYMFLKQRIMFPRE